MGCATSSELPDGSTSTTSETIARQRVLYRVKSNNKPLSAYRCPTEEDSFAHAAAVLEAHNRRAAAEDAAASTHAAELLMASSRSTTAPPMPTFVLDAAMPPSTTCTSLTAMRAGSPCEFPMFAPPDGSQAGSLPGASLTSEPVGLNASRSSAARAPPSPLLLDRLAQQSLSSSRPLSICPFDMLISDDDDDDDDDAASDGVVPARPRRHTALETFRAKLLRQL